MSSRDVGDSEEGESDEGDERARRERREELKKNIGISMPQSFERVVA